MERGTIVQEGLFVGPPMERRAKSSQWQTCKLSLTLSESTRRDGLRLASCTPQVALRPPKRSAEDMLFDYLEPEGCRIHNDLARRIQKRFHVLENAKSKRRDRRSVKPLTNLIQE